MSTFDFAEEMSILFAELPYFMKALYKFLSLLLFFIVVMTAVAVSQPVATTSCPVNTFQKELLNPFTHLTSKSANSVIQAKDSSILILGRMSDGYYSGYEDSNYLTKLSPTGDVLWSRLFPGNDYSPQQVIELPDNDFLAIFNNANIDTVLLIKFTNFGTIAWQKNLRDITPGGQDIMVYSALFTEGFIFMEGFSADGVMLFKFSLEGNLLWSYTYKYPQILFGLAALYSNKLMVDDGDGLILAYPITPVSVFNHVPIIKVNKANGNLIWSKAFYTPGTTFLVNELIKTSQGFALSYQSRLTSQSASERKAAIANISSEGNFINGFKIINLDPKQNFILNEEGKFVGAAADTAAASSAPFIIFQADPTGNIEWSKKYTVPANNATGAIRPLFLKTNDKALAIVVSHKSTITQQRVNHILKTDYTGNAGDCENININVITEQYSLIANDIVPFVFQNVIDVSEAHCTIADEQLYSNTICARVSTCDSIKILGKDSSCSFKDPVYFKVYRNPACFTTPIWKLADTSYGSIRTLSDSSIEIIFKRSGTVMLRSFLPTPCKILEDSLLLHIFEPANALDLGPDKKLCVPTPTTLHAKTGYKKYQWQDGSSAENFIANTYGLYFVTVTDHCGNSFRDSLIILPKQPDPINIGNDTFKCNQDSIRLTAPSGFGNYTWSPAYKIMAVGAEAIIFPETDTSYYITAEKTPGCISRDTIHIKVYKTNPINLGKDTSLCSGSSIVLDAGNGFDRYFWNNGSVAQQLPVSQAGLYFVKASDIHGCFSTDSFRVVSIYPNPILSLNKNAVLCTGQSLRLDAGGGFSNYQWQDASNQRYFTLNQTGKYWVTVKDSRNCSSSDTVFINSLKPLPSNFIFSDTMLCLGSSIRLQPSTNFISYLWSNGALTKDIRVNQSGTYWLQVIDANGCIAKETIHVREKDCTTAVYFPAAFTPNGDSWNDFFGPGIFGNINNYSLTIYNRYGEIVFTTKDPLKKWDGRYKGKAQNSGSYTWICHYSLKNDVMETQKGTVLLLR